MAKQKHSPRGARDDDCERRATRGLQSSLQRQRRLVDGDAGAHRRADRDLLQVGALGGGRLGLDQVHEQRLQVVLQLVGIEVGLADRAVDDAGLVGAVADLAALEIGRAHVELQSLMRISYAVFCLQKKKYIDMYT